MRAGVAVAGFSKSWNVRIMSMTAANEYSGSSSVGARDSARSLSKSIGAGGQA